MKTEKNPNTLGILNIDREVKGSIERVFQAFTDPVKMSQWFFGFPGGSARIEQDFRVGGKYLIEMIHPQTDLSKSEEECDSPVHHGEYLEINSPVKLSFTWINENFVKYSIVTINFSETKTGTLISLRHELPPEVISPHTLGWNACLDNLEILINRELS